MICMIYAYTARYATFDSSVRVGSGCKMQLGSSECRDRRAASCRHI